jgi:hypothetical protein
VFKKAAVNEVAHFLLVLVLSECTLDRLDLRNALPEFRVDVVFVAHVDRRTGPRDEKAPPGSRGYFDDLGELGVTCANRLTGRSELVASSRVECNFSEVCAKR